MILSDDSISQQIYENTVKLGFNPVFILMNKIRINPKLPQISIDFYDSIDNIIVDIKKKIGDIYGIVCCIEQLVYKVGQIEERLGLQTNNIGIYHILRDKRAMKKIWMENNINTPKVYGSYRSISELNNISSNNFQFPLIIKPSCGAASAGVCKINNVAELYKKAKEIILFNHTTLNKEGVSKSGFILEEYIEGEEFSVDTIWIKGKPIINGVMSKGNPKGPIFPDRLYYIDKFMHDERLLQIIEESHSAIEVIGVENGATHTELRIKENKPYIIESAIRPGAGGEFYKLFTLSTGIDYVKYFIISEVLGLIECYSGEEYQFNPLLNTFLYNVPYNGNGIIKKQTIDDKLLKRYGGIIKNIHFQKYKGDYLPLETQSMSYFAWVEGNFPDELINSDVKEVEIEKILLNIDEGIKIEFE